MAAMPAGALSNAHTVTAMMALLSILNRSATLDAGVRTG